MFKYLNCKLLLKEMLALMRGFRQEYFIAGLPNKVEPNSLKRSNCY